MIKKTIFPYELIGEEVEVIAAENKFDLGIKGKVVDETRETVVIQVETNKFGKDSAQMQKSKRLLKKNITLKMIKTGQTIDGKSLLKRPEERIKG